MTKQRKMYRQGDILLVEVTDEVCGRELSRGSCVLAYGEATGHHHSITHPGATLWAVNENLRILELEEAADLVHPEHAPVKIAPCRYQVIQQRENTALGWRVVSD